MSYLDLPRIHFAGRFLGDVSTANNVAANYVPPPAGQPPITTPLWNVNGTHRFALRNCRVTGVMGSNGRLLTAAAGDPLVGTPVRSNDRGRLVDLDPGQQLASQIWAHQMEVRSTSGEGFQGTMAVATMRELWERTSGTELSRFSASYQSVLTGVTWAPATGPFASPVLEELGRTRPQTLSVKMVLYGYDATSGSTTFGTGLVVGTIGPFAAGEPHHMIVGRKLFHAGSPQPLGLPFNSAAFNAAPFKVDESRRRLVVDFGNAFKDSAVGGQRVQFQELFVEVFRGTGTTPVRIGPIPNDTPRALTNAGIEEFPLTPAQVGVLRSNVLRVRARPAGGQVTVALVERADGVLADVTQRVVRLNPRPIGSTDPNRTLPGNTQDVDVIVTRHGVPAPNEPLLIGPSVTPSAGGSPPIALSVRANGITLSLPAVANADASGRLRLTLVAGNPGTPRAPIDGVVTFVGVYHGTAVSPANLHGEISVRVFSSHTLPPTPSYADVRPILAQYGRLYPSMKPSAGQGSPVDLESQTSVESLALLVRQSILRDLTDPQYMPVTRDLSADKTRLLVEYLDAVIRAQQGP